MNSVEFELKDENFDNLFECLINKRRKYDGNSIIHMIIKFEKTQILEFFFSN